MLLIVDSRKTQSKKATRVWSEVEVIILKDSRQYVEVADGGHILLDISAVDLVEDVDGERRSGETGQEQITSHSQSG